MNSNIRNTNKNMGKIVSKFQIDMLYGKPVIKMLDNLNSIAKSIIVVESDSLSRNIDQVLSHVYDEHKSFREGFAPVKFGNLWGYVNLTLKDVLSLQYNEAYPVREGFALVNKEDKYYFWKMNETPIVQWNEQGYEKASPFCNGLALVKRDGLYGYLSNVEKNKEEIPCQYEDACDFDTVYPYAVIKLNGKYGMINKSGEIILEPIFDFYSSEAMYDPNSKKWYNAIIRGKRYRLNPDATYVEIEK